MSRKISIIITTILTLLAISSLSAHAKTSIKDAHDQLLNTGNATVYIDEETEAVEYIAQITTIDEDTPYDADMIEVRGTGLNYTVFSDGKVEISTKNVLNIEETEKLLDTIVAEINSTLPEEPSQSQIIKAIGKYISKTFKYDNEAFKNREIEQNFVDAYYGNRRIICGQYAAATYLLCNRYGIDCKIVQGNRHVYNAIRLDNETKYTAYDFTKTAYHLSPKVTYADFVTGNYTLAFDSNKLNKELGKTLNSRVEITYTFPALLVVTLAVISIVLLTKKSARKRRKSHRS